MTRCPARPRDRGSLALETVFTVPVIMLALLAVLETIGVARDALLVHEAARAGARAAATSLGPSIPHEAARQAADGRPVTVRIDRPGRQPGELVTVSVRLVSRLGPLRPEVSASAVARVEPGATG